MFFALNVTAAKAETATIASGSPGSVHYNLVLAISKAANEVQSMDLRPKPYKSQGQGAVFTNKGDVDFGIHNAIILREAFLGLEFFDGRALSDVRAVARLVPLQIGLAVPGDSDIQSVADIRGKRIAAGFDATAFGERLYDVILGTAGLSYDDVETVQVAGWQGFSKAFIEGDLDAGTVVVGSPTTVRYAQHIEGLRAISIGTDEGVEAGIQKAFPASRLVTVQPADRLAGILEPTVVLEYDYWLFANKDTSDAKVTALLKSLYQGKEVMASTSADFRNFDPALMNDDIGVPFHPAATAFYAAN